MTLVLSLIFDTKLHNHRFLLTQQIVLSHLVFIRNEAIVLVGAVKTFLDDGVVNLVQHAGPDCVLKILSRSVCMK